MSLGISKQPYSGKVLKSNSHLCLLISSSPKIQLKNQTRHMIRYMHLYIQEIEILAQQHIQCTLSSWMRLLSHTANELSSHTSFLSLKKQSLLQVTSVTPYITSRIRRTSLIYTITAIVSQHVSSQHNHTVRWITTHVHISIILFSWKVYPCVLSSHNHIF